MQLKDKVKYMYMGHSKYQTNIQISFENDDDQRSHGDQLGTETTGCLTDLVA